MEVVAEMKKKVITNIGEINVLSKRVHSELEKLDTEFEHLHAAVVKTEKQILGTRGSSETTDRHTRPRFDFKAEIRRISWSENDGEYQRRHDSTENQIR